MEEFKNISGFPGYQVSNHGRIKSLKSGYFLIGCFDKKGYLMVCLQKPDKTQSTKRIHQLVAIEFLKHKPCGHYLVVNHKDFNKTNNKLDNLEIVTNRENSNKKHLKSVSKYTGVFWHSENKKWVAQIVFQGKNKYLGSFLNEDDANHARVSFEKSINI